MRQFNRFLLCIFVVFLFFSCKKIQDIYEPEIKIVTVNNQPYTENSSIEAESGDIVKMEITFFCEQEFESSLCANTKGNIYDFVKTDGYKGDINGTLSLEVDVDELWNGSLFGGVFTLAVFDQKQNMGTKKIQINRKR